MSQLTVYQTTKPGTIKLLITANLICYVLLWNLHQEYPDTVPEIHYLCLFINGYLFQVLRRSERNPLDDVNKLEFYKDAFMLFLIMLLPVGVAFLVFNFIVTASFPTMLVTFIIASVAGVALIYSVGSNKIILKEHVAVFMHGVYFKKTKTLAYEDIDTIILSAARESITISSRDGSVRETYTWMSNLDNLHRLLQQRVLSAKQKKPVATSSLTTEELIEKRLSGRITDDEFIKAVDSRIAAPGDTLNS